MGGFHLVPYVHETRIRVRFDEEVYGQVLHWNPELLEALRRRGAVVQDFPASLDDYIARLDGIPSSVVAGDFERFKLFYFDHVDDAARKTAFQRRLGVVSGR